MEAAEVFTKLESFERTLAQGKAAAVTTDTLPTASMKEFLETKSLLSQFSTALQGEAIKLTLFIGHGASDMAAARSIHKAFIQPLEGLVTIASVISTTDFGLCDNYRSFLLSTVRAVTDAAKQLLETCSVYAETPNGPERSALHPKLLMLTGVVNAKCNQIRLVPVSNTSAVVRHMLQTAVVCKDMVKEFNELLDKNEESAADGSSLGRNGDSLPEGRSGAEVEIGSDEWYAMMDSFGGEESCTEEEATVMKAQVAMIDSVYALLRCVSNMVKLTEDSNDREQQRTYRVWLNETVRLNETLTESLTDLGATLNPPHDASLDEKAATAKLNAVALATHIHKHTVNESRRQHTCFKRYVEFMDNLK